MPPKPSAQDLENLRAKINNENTKVEDILVDPAFPHSAQTGFEPLVEYIFSEQVFQTLVDWFFTDTIYDEKSDCYTKSSKLTRSLISIFTSPSSKIQPKIKANPNFIDKLITFPESEFAKNSKVASNFVIIVEIFSRHTSGDFLGKIPKLADYLIKYSHFLGNRELFYTLLTEFPQKFLLNQDLAMKISQQIYYTEDPYFISSLISQVIELKPDNIKYFLTKEVIDILLETALDENKSLYSKISIFNLIDVIFSKSKDEDKKMFGFDNFTEKFKKEKNTTIVGLAIKFMNEFPPDLIKNLFDEDFNVPIARGLIEVIGKMDMNRLEKLIQDHNLFNKVIDTVHKDVINPFAVQLGQILNSKLTENSYLLIPPEWGDFVSGTLKNRTNSLEGKEIY